jgi:hypothetical protein
MKKKRWLLLPGILLIAALAVWLEPTRIVWGYLMGDSFYAGRPTRYWSQEIERWTEKGPRKAAAPASPGMMDQIKAYIGLDVSEPDTPVVLHGDPEALSVLAELLKDNNAILRRQAAMVLAMTQPPIPGAVSPLTEALSDSDDLVRWQAAQGLAMISPDEAEAAIPVLVEMLRLENRYWAVRMRAAFSLQRIGPPAREAVPALSEILKDPDLQDPSGELHQAADDALTKIDPVAAAKARLQ